MVSAEAIELIRLLFLLLSTSQSAEMEALLSSKGGGDAASSGVVERLVAKHVEEVAALARRWETERAESKRRQRETYRDDVRALRGAMEQQRYGSANATPSSPLRRPLVTIDSAPPSSSSSSSAVNDVDAPASSRIAGSVRGAARSLFSLGRKSKAAPAAVANAVVGNNAGNNATQSPTNSRK
jgi:hypothetical protein